MSKSHLDICGRLNEDGLHRLIHGNKKPIVGGTVWERLGNVASLEEVCLGFLREKGLTMATAESCTGGNIAHRMTMLAGVSEVFQGGVVSYSNEVKAGVLGVDRSVIEANGAVSEQVASQMASGACRKLGADCAVATSGIAGPSGGSADKPVGMVCMAFAMPEGVHTETFRFPGDRGRVIDRASTMALIRMVQWLRKESVR